MELSVCLPIVFPGMPLHEALLEVATLGYHYVECWCVSDEEVAPLCQAVEKSGVRIISIVADDFILNVPTHRDVWLSALEKTAQRARTLGCSFIITQVGQTTDAPYEEQYASIVEGLRAASKIMQKYGLTLLIEPLNTIVNHPGYFLVKSRDAFRMIDAVDSPYVRVVYDIYHQQISEGNIVPTILENLDKIPHLHAAAHPMRCEIFLGENNYRFIFKSLEQAGYTGVVTLEYKPLLPPRESLEKTLKYIK